MISVVNAPLVRGLTTLGLGGTAVALVTVDEARDLEALPDALSKLDGVPVMLGRGSNILADDGPLPLVLVRNRFRQAPQILGQREHSSGAQILVRVGAGLMLPELLAWCVREGLAGLEGLAGVPGQLGGVVAMNAGSYGCEIGPCLATLRVFTQEMGLLELEPGAFVWRYRGMDMPGLGKHAWWLACEATLALRPDNPQAIKERFATALHQKKASQPLSAHSAGCVFRNPVGHSAGKLLDAAGFRGKKLGGMAFSALHANFLINEGQGTASAALDLIAAAQDVVRQQCGVELELEVHRWQSR